MLKLKVLKEHCTIFHSLQGPFESCHKVIRYIRAKGARPHDKEGKEDIMHKMMIKSDPDVRARKPKEVNSVKPKFGPLNEEETIKESFFL